MFNGFQVALFAFSLYVFSLPAFAGPCDYRLSNLIGSGPTAVVETSTVIAAPAALKAAGFYSIVHSTSGAAMIGSTLAGPSAAGTVGIMGGTSGFLGSAFGAVSAAGTAVPPLAVFVGAIAGVATVGTEGVCYFSDERVTDYRAVYDIVSGVVADGDSTKLGLVQVDGTSNWLWMKADDGTIVQYDVMNLYFVNGELFHRDWLANTSIGIFVSDS